MSASACSTRSSSVATPSGCFRSIAMLRRPRSSTSPVRRVGRRAADGLRALDADDLGAHVGQQHGRERAGADAGDLDDPVSSEGSSHAAVRSTARHGAHAWPPIVSGVRSVRRGVRREHGVDEDRPQRLGHVVAHVGQQQQVRAGDQLGGAEATAGRDQRVVAPVDDERRHVERRQPLGAAAAGVDGGELARARPRGRRSGRSARRGLLAQRASVAVLLRLPHHPLRRRPRCTPRASVGGGAQQRRGRFGRRLADLGLAGRAHDRDQAAHARAGARWRPSGRSCRPSTRPGRGPARCRGGRADRRRRRPCR